MMSITVLRHLIIGMVAALTFSSYFTFSSIFQSFALREVQQKKKTMSGNSLKEKRDSVLVFAAANGDTRKVEELLSQ